MKKIILWLAAGSELIKSGMVQAQGISRWLRGENIPSKQLITLDQKADTEFFKQDPATAAWDTGKNTDCKPMPPCESANFTTCCYSEYGNSVPNTTILEVCINLFDCYTIKPSRLNNSSADADPPLAKSYVMLVSLETAVGLVSLFLIGAAISKRKESLGSSVYRVTNRTHRRIMLGTGKSALGSTAIGVVGGLIAGGVDGFKNEVGLGNLALVLFAQTIGGLVIGVREIAKVNRVSLFFGNKDDREKENTYDEIQDYESLVN